MSDALRSDRRQRLAVVLMVAVVGLLTAGCKIDPHAGHKKEVNKANDRWLELRSGLMLQMAQQQFDTGDLEQAEHTLADALNLDAANGRLHVLAGRIALERNQLERAYGRFERAIALDEQLPEARYFQGVVLQRWMRHELALENYRKAYALQADNPQYLLAIAEALVAAERPDEAIELLATRVTYFDQNASIRATLGQLHAMQRDYPRAIEYYREALLLVPDDLRLLEDLATAQIAAGQYTEGLRHLERLCDDKRLEGRRDLRVTLAASYQRAGRHTDAQAAYLRLTKADPQDLESWTRLAELAWSQGDEDGTLLAATRMMNIAPRDPDGYVFAGLAWQKRGQTDRALTHFDRAAELAPRDANPVILRGLALQRANRRSAAAEAYAEALRRNPDDARAQQLLANVAPAGDPMP